MRAFPAFEIGEWIMSCRKRTAYLAGAMDAVPDRGIGWRKVFASALAGIGIGTIIPNDLEGKKLSPGQVVALKAKEDLGEFKRLFRRGIICPDLEAMDGCDMVVARWDGEAIAGTAHECGRAFMRGQPVFLVSPKAFAEVPNWLLACCEREFHCVDDLVGHLKRTRMRRRKGIGE
jgi:hypothetical protein